jgi:heptosyltransferase-3
VGTPGKGIRKPLRYRVDGWIRQAAMHAISGLAPRSKTESLDPRSASIKKILLVRANFRMGNAILALPAIAAFRKNFPDASIDFVGSPISNLLFQGQSLNHHFVAPRRFPRVVWGYPQMMRRLRANRYDLAVEVSCSQSGIGSFIVGLSGARIRAGIAGKWDRLFNLRIDKFTTPNKYRKLSEFLAALGLQQIDSVGSLVFTAAEKTAGLKKLESLTRKINGGTVGVFVGGSKILLKSSKGFGMTARRWLFFSGLKKKILPIRCADFSIRRFRLSSNRRRGNLPRWSRISICSFVATPGPCISPAPPAFGCWRSSRPAT